MAAFVTAFGGVLLWIRGGRSRDFEPFDDRNW